MTPPAPALILDTLGQVCPMPVILLAQRISEVPVGATVAVLSDDPAAALDLPAWCGMRGQTYLGATPLAGSGASYLIQRLR